MTGYSLGVDLGTSYTAAAIFRGGRLEMVTLGNRTAEVPSVAFLDRNGELEVGEAAERRGTADPRRVVRDFKRRIGDPTPIILAGSPFAPEGLMAATLERVLAVVAEQQGGPPDAVVLTHPANWGAYKRELFFQVPALAGLAGFGTATEPEAAAVHFASTTRVRVGDLVAVYDLGGGTFDAAVLRKTDSGFELLGKPEGIEHLGGADFDDAVMAHVRAALGDVIDVGAADEAARTTTARFRLDCVQAKENLSYDHETTIVVLLPGVHTEVRLTRDEFEEMIGPAVDATVRALGRALRAAGVAAEQVATVLLAGGSSRIPLVAERIIEHLQIPVAVSGHPKHSVALGAAYLAGTSAGAGDGPAVVMPVTSEADDAGQAPRPIEPAPHRRRAPGRRGWLAAAAVAVIVGVVIGTIAVVRGGASSGADDAGAGAAATDPSTTSSSSNSAPTTETSSSSSTTTSSSSSSSTTTSSSPSANNSASAGGVPDPARWCDTLKGSFGDIRGKTVQILAADNDAEGYQAGFKPWEQCTGGKIKLIGAASPSAVTEEATSDLNAGDPPDLVATAHPGAIIEWARSGGNVQPLPALAQANLAAFYAKSWADIGSVDGTVYAVPGNTTVKSLVWYSPKRFAAKGYHIPATVDELVDLTETIAARGGTPWCLGNADGSATGWPLSDWLEDIVLRQGGTGVYDQWVAHSKGFTSHEIADALATLGALVTNEKYLAGGRAGSAKTPWGDDGKRLGDGACEMVHQAGFLRGKKFPADATIGPDKDIFVFPLPAVSGATSPPVLVGGDMVVRLTDRPESASAQTYLTLPKYAETRMQTGQFLSPNEGADSSRVTDPILQLERRMLTAQDTVIRFDASDLMPAEVGTDAEWKQLTLWLGGSQDDATTLANIDAAWPS